MSALIPVKRLATTQRRDYFMGVLMHRCIYGNAPNYLNLLRQVCHVQQRFTRSRYDFYVTRANIELCKKSFLYNGPRLWNTLPDF